MIYTSKGSKKGTIFCIHGNSSSAQVFHKLLQSDKILNTKAAIDLKGHGNNQSSDFTIADFTFNAQKQFIIEQLSEINDDLLIIGNSLGGHLAIEIASKIKNLKGLVIIGAPPLKKPINFEEAFHSIQPLNVYFEEKPSNADMLSAIKLTVKKKNKIQLISKDFIRANPLVRKAIAIDITQNKLHDEYGLFTKLNVPKFVIAGDSDLAVNRKYLETVKLNCKNHCEIIDLVNCGHFPSIDKPKQFVRVIGDVANKVFS